jgi:hypothetical protein
MFRHKFKSNDMIQFIQVKRKYGGDALMIKINPCDDATTTSINNSFLSRCLETNNNSIATILFL